MSARREGLQVRSNFSVLLRLEHPLPEYRWRLVDSIYRSAQAVIEGTLALLLVLGIAEVRTGWPVFGWGALALLAITTARLWDRSQYMRAAGPAISAPRGTPEGWALRHASGAFVTSCLWGVTDLCVLARFDDPLLQMFTLMVQAGWLAGACLRAAASPITLFGQALLALVPSEAGLLLAHDGMVKIILPLVLLHFSALIRTGRWLGAQLVAMIESEHLMADAYTQLARLSAMDGLTGIANRRAFDAALMSEWHRATRESTDLALLMIDVDFFKLYNDRYGHLGGDDCLRTIAGHVSRALLRGPDLAARYGGEEFAALLPGISEQGARDVADRLRADVEAARLPHAAAPLGHISVSIGVASLAPTPHDEPQSLVSLADNALYDAKRAGRNQVRCASDRLRLGQWRAEDRATLGPAADKSR
jgi:two-component system chemotaxis family response regulator WspR